MRRYTFQQVDVFTDTPYLGNPLAVVVGADDWTEAQMAQFANWTNLSETTFLTTPTHPDADYGVRIFTPARELPFAGHPTLGSAHVWLENGGTPKAAQIVQDCAAGLIQIRRDGSDLAFAAPPLTRSGPVDAEDLVRITAGLGGVEILDTAWIDNGPGWIGVRLADRDTVLSVTPDFAAFGGLRIGLVGPWAGGEADVEVRAFSASGYEDPVTGSLNAGLAQWLIGAGVLPDSYRARQGTVLGRKGTVEVHKSGDDIWVGGAVVTCITGQVSV